MFSADDRDSKFFQLLCKSRKLDKVVQMLWYMSTPPTVDSYLCILKACIKTNAIVYVHQVHSHLLHHRVPISGKLGGYLVVAMSKCGAIDQAFQLSQKLSERNVFTWTGLISACVDYGREYDAVKLYHHMIDDCIEPNAFTYASLFKACGNMGNLFLGRRLHEEARGRGFTSQAFLVNTLVSMYGKCGSLDDAKDVFSTLTYHDAVSCNAMLSAYLEQGESVNVLRLYRQMCAEEADFDHVTFMIALQACGDIAENIDACVLSGRLKKEIAFEIGQALHKDAWQKGYSANPLIGNTILNMYGRCGCISICEEVFTIMPVRCIVSWNTMLAQYAKQGQPENVLLLFNQMQKDGMIPNNLSYTCALKACGMLSEKEHHKAISSEIGKTLYVDAKKNNLLSDLLVSNTILSMYGKCATTIETEKYFKSMPQHDVVSWNVMLSVFVEQDEVQKAVLTYDQMLKENLIIDSSTISCILQACCAGASIGMCQHMHFLVLSAGLEQTSSIVAALLRAYASCSMVNDMDTLFHQLVNPDIISSTECIAGHARKGNALLSIQMFEKVMMLGIQPDGLTFNSVLSACTRSGLITEGLHYFISMSEDFGLIPDTKHFDAIVDLCGRSGNFEKIENILGMQQNKVSPSGWLHILSACRAHGNLELAQRAFDEVVRLEPQESLPYILMSVNYVDSGIHD